MPTYRNKNEKPELSRFQNKTTDIRVILLLPSAGKDTDHLRTQGFTMCVTELRGLTAGGDVRSVAQAAHGTSHTSISQDMRQKTEHVQEHRLGCPQATTATSPESLLWVLPEETL